MATLKEIREDLKEIRHYYSRKEIFEIGFRVVGTSEIVQKAERYNLAIRSASPKLYDLYISLYLQNRTQSAYSLEFNYSPEYVYQMHRKLTEFFYEKFKA